MEKENNKIILKNERSGHVKKLVNELGSWGFFKVIYRNDMLKIIGLNLMLLILFAPAIFLGYRYTSQVAQFTARLPVSNAIGFGFAPWFSVAAELARLSGIAMTELLLWMLVASVIVGISVAGGMAVIRDSFWTGRLKIFKAFGRGILENGLACIVCFVLFVGCINGIYHASVAMRAIPQWASILIQIVMWLVLAFFMLYMMTFLSVNSSYKQSIGRNMKSAWNILMRYIVSTLFKFVIAAIPVILLIVTFGAQLFALAIVAMAMIGFFYIIFVWQSHMMIIFSIYNPVEKIKIVKRKSQQKEQTQQKEQSQQKEQTQTETQTA